MMGYFQVLFVPVGIFILVVGVYIYIYIYNVTILLILLAPITGTCPIYHVWSSKTRNWGKKKNFAWNWLSEDDETVSFKLNLKAYLLVVFNLTDTSNRSHRFRGVDEHSPRRMQKILNIPCYGPRRLDPSSVSITICVAHVLLAKVIIFVNFLSNLAYLQIFRSFVGFVGAWKNVSLLLWAVSLYIKHFITLRADFLYWGLKATLTWWF